MKEITAQIRKAKRFVLHSKLGMIFCSLIIFNLTDQVSNVQLYHIFLGTTVTVDPDTEPLFSGVHILNEGKTLRLPSKYEYYGVKFKCQVSRDTVTILSEDFNQPVIVPKV